MFHSSTRDLHRPFLAFLLISNSNHFYISNCHYNKSLKINIQEVMSQISCFVQIREFIISNWSLSVLQLTKKLAEQFYIAKVIAEIEIFRVIYYFLFRKKHEKCLSSVHFYLFLLLLNILLSFFIYISILTEMMIEGWIKKENLVSYVFSSLNSV